MNDNEKILTKYIQLQHLYSRLKVRIFMLSLYFKRIHNYYNKYKQNITTTILNDKNFKIMLYKSIPVYRIRNLNIQQQHNNLSPNIIKLTDKEYYQLLAIKIILRYLLNYENTIRVYLKKLQEYFYNIIEMKKIIYQTCCYSLDLMYTKGRGKNNDDFIDNIQEILLFTY